MNTFYIGVKGIIKSKSTGDVLILEKSKPHKNGTRLDLPGGRIENNNDFLQTLKRELEEEVGITPKDYHLINLSPIGTSIVSYKIDNFAGLVLTYFELEVEDNFTPSLSDEHSSYKWYSFDAYAQLITEDPQELLGSANYIEQVLSNSISR